MIPVYSNDAHSTLAAPLSAEPVSVIQFPAGHGALWPAIGPGQYAPATLANRPPETAWEIVHAIARAGDTLTVLRGREGTTPLAWRTGDTLEQRPTAGELQRLVDGLAGIPGELRVLSGGAAPDGWLAAEGQLLAPGDFPALFARIGATYGGDGVADFALPNKRTYGQAKTLICVGRPGPYALVSAPAPAAIHGAPGAYFPGDAMDFTVRLLEAVSVVGGPPRLAVSIGGGAAHLLAPQSSTATAWQYALAVPAGELGEVVAAIDVNGAALTRASDAAPVVLREAGAALGMVAGIRLAGADAAVTPLAEAATLTQAHSLSAVDATAAPLAAGVAITQTQLLAAADAQSAAVADAVTLA